MVILTLDTTLMMQASMHATGEDVHRVANALAAYESARDLGDKALFEEAEMELRKLVSRRRLASLPFPPER